MEGDVHHELEAKVATFEDTQRLVRMAHLLEEGIRGAVPLGTQLVPGSQINTLPRESGWCVRFLLIFLLYLHLPWAVLIVP